VTLPPQRIGDKGQRYEIRFYLQSEPWEDERPLGYAPTLKDAREMRDAWLKRTDIGECFILDRQTGKRVI
jgi:hypothetical protein